MMNDNCKRITEHPSKNSTESLLNSYVKDGLFLENLKENKDIGPWEQENTKVFDLFCSELEGSKQFFKHSIHSKTRQKQLKKKKGGKNEDYQAKYFKDKTSFHQNNAHEDITIATQVQSTVQQSISQKGSGHGKQDGEIPNHNKQFESLENETQSEFVQYHKQNKQSLEKYQPIVIQSYMDQSVSNYNTQMKRKSINEDSQIMQNHSYHAEEKIMMELFKKKSQSVVRQNEQLLTQNQISKVNIQKGSNSFQLSQSSTGYYQTDSANHIQQSSGAASSQQQLVIGYFDSLQATQVEQLEKKILQKYFAFYPSSSQQTPTLSPKNQAHTKNNVQVIIKKENPSSPKAQQTTNEYSPSKNHQQKEAQPPFSEATQLQQALKNQSIKFKKIKSLRSKFKPISTHSSQEKIHLINTRDFNEKMTLQNGKQKYSTQEDVPANLVQPNNQSKNLPVLKGNGIGGQQFDPLMLKESKEKMKIDLTQQQQQQPVLLQNQKYHHQNNIQINYQQNNNQGHQIQQMQYSLPQSARDFSQIDQVYSTISRYGGSQSRKNSFRYSRVESRDSYHQISFTKPLSNRNELESSRITPLKSHNLNNVSQIEIPKINNELRQQYYTNSPWSKKNTSKLPQLILSSILNNGGNQEDTTHINSNIAASKNTQNNDYILQNINSSRIVNFPIYDDKPPTSRFNHHLNSQSQTKYIQLYYYRTAKKTPAHTPRDITHSPTQLIKHIN